MHQDFEARLRQALIKQTGKVKYFCHEANSLPNVAVHETRKSFKRIRALLQLIQINNAAKTKRIIKDLKQYGRNISTLRESYVNLQNFDKVSVKDSIAERKVKQVKELLFDKNKKLLNDWNDGRNFSSTIMQFIVDFEKEVVKNEKFILNQNEAIKNLWHSYRMSYLFYTKVGADSDGHEWHELRKKLKTLWYQIDFLKYLYPRYLNAKADQLNFITEQLGDDHDLYVLCEVLKKEKLTLDSYEQLVLCNKSDHLRQIIQVKLAPRLRQFFSDSPDEFQHKTRVLLLLEE
jgi:CHAD domain-containing protein